MRIPLMKSDSFTLAFIQKSTLHHENDPTVFQRMIQLCDVSVISEVDVVFLIIFAEKKHIQRKESDLRQNHVEHHRKDKQGRGKVSSQQNNETTFLFLYGKLNKCFHFVEVVKQSHKQTR